ncbi:hypothetical protein DVH24_004746 [Malus domestica]|uniref:Uncharacterized protein n=1 Tax=Malus domestica TaxID=3750 RepID=A0A498IFA8_MALDO|nr:hypothetical protein DVH24_004746 [Malus domestica]
MLGSVLFIYSSSLILSLSASTISLHLAISSSTEFLIPETAFRFYLSWDYLLQNINLQQLKKEKTPITSRVKKKKGRTQCTRLPLYAGSGRGECRLALPPFMERLLPSLEPETYCSWAKALAIAPSATSAYNIKS